MDLTSRDVWRLTKMPDVCMTDIIKTRQFNRPNYAARRWSQVIALPAFKEVRKEAHEAYCLMTEYENYCPEVRKLGTDGLEMEWNSESRIAIIQFRPSSPLFYSWGCKGKSPRFIALTRPLDEMLCRFSHFHSSQAEMVDDGAGSDEVRDGGCSGC